MKSQVNNLLHVARGICKDVLATYPALEESLSKDMDRLALYCQTRGQGVFLLDLPCLEASLLAGLETGRLVLEGPLSTVVSSKTQVPRIFSGLWLRVFDRDACLKREVDVNALFFLRQLLVVGKKIEVDCSGDRLLAKVKDYHDIERKLRKPSYTWQYDSFHLDSRDGRDDSDVTRPSTHGCGPCGRNLGDHDLLHGSSSDDEWPVEDVDSASEDGCSDRYNSPVHLVQAVDYLYPSCRYSTSLFHNGYGEVEASAKVADIRLLNKIQQVADLIFGSMEVFDPVTFSGNLEEDSRGIGFRHGPGAVAEQKKNWEKSQFDNWPAKLQYVFPYELCGTTAGSSMDRPPNHERASRLLAVPKTAKGPRLIAAEPTSHQWCQQLLLRFLFDQCKTLFKGSFIDFRDQGKSGDLVLQSSLDRKLATVDLSDASDRLSCWTVERIVRANPALLHALHAARTRHIFDSISDVPSFLSLRKFASQGTATTFPVMSLTMLCIALGSVIQGDKVSWAQIWKFRDQVRVFGDDIIVPEYGYGDLVRAMELLELKVNTAKSYVHGHFRESCGVDGYMGYDITPVKPTTLDPDSPASCQAVVDTSNNLFNKGLWHASLSASELLPSKVRQYLRVVARNDAGFSGLTSFSGSDEHHLSQRWNPRLHRTEVRVWSTLGQARKVQRDDVGALLDFFSRAHSVGNPRVVSEYLDVRKSKARLLWEPQNTDARIYVGRKRQLEPLRLQHPIPKAGKGCSS